MNSAIRILLADDDEYDSLLTRRALTPSVTESDIITVTDGLQVLDFLYRRRQFVDQPSLQPSFVLLDLKMPLLDGFEVLTRTKSDSVLKVIPIIVLTSSRQPNDRERAYQLGANGYVVKTMDFEAYTESLRALSRFWLDINEVPPTCRGRIDR